MGIFDYPPEATASILCKPCGLCCTGHLFLWARLRSAELDPIEALGVKVLRSDPNHRGFNQPCPLWKEQCTVYTEPHYPRICKKYQCKVLKDLYAEKLTLSEAQSVIQTAKAMIAELEPLLPPSIKTNFRERLVAEIESGKTLDPEFRSKAEALIVFYDEKLGVNDLIDKPEEE
jgi:hypothetical protein